MHVAHWGSRLLLLPLKIWKYKFYLISRHGATVAVTWSDLIWPEQNNDEDDVCLKSSSPTWAQHSLVSLREVYVDNIRSPHCPGPSSGFLILIPVYLGNVRLYSAVQFSTVRLAGCQKCSLEIDGDIALELLHNGSDVKYFFFTPAIIGWNTITLSHCHMSSPGHWTERDWLTDWLADWLF